MSDFDFAQHRQTQDLAEAARLMRDYFEVKSELEAREAQADELRRDLQVIVESLGGSIKIDHVGTAAITPASTSQSYDKTGINNVLSLVIMSSAQAQKNGDLHTFRMLAEIAQLIEAARKDTTRKAALRITGAK
jgi:hypothetical protein